MAICVRASVGWQQDKGSSCVTARQPCVSFSPSETGHARTTYLQRGPDGCRRRPGADGAVLCPARPGMAEVKRLVLVDSQPQIQVGPKKVGLVEFAASLENPNGTTIDTVVLDVTSVEQVTEFYAKTKDIGYS